MATKDRVTIELYVDDQGTVKIRSAKKELEDLGRAGEKGFGGAASAADNFASSLLKQAGVYALVIGSAYKLADTLGGAFKAGIKAAEEFRTQTISIAAGLTNMAASGQGSFKDMFQQNLAFSRTMYEEMRKEDAKRFASLEDLMAGYNAMVQKGYAVRLNEVDALGVLVDRIKLATVGQNTSMQINQEIRSLMDGQARAGSLLAQELQSRVGPGWADIVEKHKEAGTLLEYLAGLWPGIGAAAQEIENTLEAQTTTLSGNLKYVGREGLGGAYEWVVDQVRQLNEYLRVHGAQLSGEILTAWNNIRPLAQSVLDIMVAMISVAGKVASAVSRIAGGLANTKAAMDQIYGFGGTSMAIEEAGKAKTSGLVGYGSEGEGAVGNHAAIGQTVAKKMISAAAGGGGGKGAGGAQSSIDRMATIVDGLERELARISEGGLAEIQAWERQQINSIEKVARKGAEGAEALALVERVKLAKIRKLNEEFEKWHAGAVKDQYKSLEMEQANYLKKYQGNKEQEARITQVFGKKKQELEIQSANEVLGIYQDQYQKMAELTHLGLPTQMRYQMDLIRLEDERVRNNLMLLRLQGKISDAQLDQLQTMRQVTTQAKLQEKEWQLQGFGGGLRAGAKGMVEANQASGYERGRALLGNMQQYVSSMVSRGLISALKGEKTSLADLGWSIGETAIQAMVDLAMSQLFVMLAQGILTSSLPLVTAGTMAGVQLQVGAATAGATLIAAATTAASIMAASKVGFGFFHGGGIVAHSGLIVAHNGLNLRGDERLAKLQVGEWVLQRRAAQRLAAQGVNFQQLNRGQAPGGRAVTIPLTINVPGAGGKMQTYRETIRVTDQALKKREINLRKGRR